MLFEFIFYLYYRFGGYAFGLAALLCLPEYQLLTYVGINYSSGITSSVFIVLWVVHFWFCNTKEDKDVIL